MAFRENKAAVRQSERREIKTQVPESQERKGTSFRDKVNGWKDRLGEKFARFGGKKKATESAMANVAPDAAFTPDEAGKLTAVEADAEATSAKAAEALEIMALEAAEGKPLSPEQEKKLETLKFEKSVEEDGLNKDKQNLQNVTGNLERNKNLQASLEGKKEMLGVIVEAVPGSHGEWVLVEDTKKFQTLSFEKSRKIAGGVAKNRSQGTKYDQYNDPVVAGLESQQAALLENKLGWVPNRYVDSGTEKVVVNGAGGIIGETGPMPLGKALTKSIEANQKLAEEIKNKISEKEQKILKIDSEIRNLYT